MQVFRSLLTYVWQLNYTGVLFQIGDNMLRYRGGGGGGGWLPILVGKGSLMTHNAGSVTTHSVAFKYRMTSEPYR
jgi:hypothetical protein